MPLVLALAVLAAVLFVSLVTLSTVVVRRRRGRGVELEPPPRPGLGRPQAPPRPGQRPRPGQPAARPAGRPPSGRAPSRPGPPPPVEVDPDLAAQIEEAFAPAPEVEPRPEGPEPRSEGPEPLGEPGTGAAFDVGPVPDAELTRPEEVPPEELPEELVEVLPERPRFRDRLGKARSFLSGPFRSIAARNRIDEETWEELEEALILADVGAARTAALLEPLRGRVKAGQISTADGLLEGLKADLKTAMTAGDRSLHLSEGPANVWLFVGVNGVGKTTTIGKLGMREIKAGRSVVMAAGDTFRAAAAEQLELWAQRVGADLVRGAEGGDPGSVVFDAVQRAAAKDADLVLADTAGRLHTKVNLMEELKKVRRVAERPPGQLGEVLLVIDATTGQNGLVQARQFAEAVGVTGIVLTKLDGTAKGGIALAIQGELGLPIKLVGLGETAVDLVEFDPEEFVDALFE